MDGSWLGWSFFIAFILVMLALDLGVFHRKAHVVSLPEAISWSIVWVLLALAFNGVLVTQRGAEVGLEFFTGYLVEKALSVDNVFVFVMIFAYFKTPALYQHKVLFWGVLGALAMRAVFIFAGIELLKNFSWLMYFFGALLVFSGIKMIAAKNHQTSLDANPVVRLVRWLMPVSSTYHGDRLLIREAGKWVATPLFVVLLLVEASDLIFAVDSIPAILAITQDPFIVFTSNVFAILGLRSLYFAISGLMSWFHLLHYGLSAILCFVGGKMIYSELTHEKVPTGLSLAVILGLLAVSIGASLLIRPRSEPAGAAPASEGSTGS